MKINNSNFPVDFIIIDIAPIKDVHIQIAIVLIHPFLTTANAVLSCRNGVVKLSLEI